MSISGGSYHCILLEKGTESLSLHFRNFGFLLTANFAAGCLEDTGNPEFGLEGVRERMWY